MSHLIPTCSQVCMYRKHLGKTGNINKIKKSLNILSSWDLADA